MDSEQWLDQQLRCADLDPRSEQALEWVARLATGEADGEALAEFARWRDRDPRNEKALIAARRLWLDIGTPLEAARDPAVVARAAVQRSGKRAAYRMLAAAAALTLAVGIGRQWSHDWRYDQVTAVGEQRAVALADGSTMWLDTDSAVDLDIDEHGRRVRLARGEAYFDVRKNPKLPFVVDAGTGRVKVLGTAFSVRREGEDVRVTVQRGRVEVSGRGTAAVLLAPDQTVWLRRGDVYKQPRFVDAERALSWRRGRLQFENRPIAEVLEELRRYDPRYVVLDYPHSRRLRVNAVIDLARISEWYDSLEQSLPLTVTQFGPFVWIRQRNVQRALADVPRDAHAAS